MLDDSKDAAGNSSLEAVVVQCCKVQHDLTTWRGEQTSLRSNLPASLRFYSCTHEETTTCVHLQPHTIDSTLASAMGSTHARVSARVTRQ